MASMILLQKFFFRLAMLVQTEDTRRRKVRLDSATFSRWSLAKATLGSTTMWYSLEILFHFSFGIFHLCTICEGES